MRDLFVIVPPGLEEPAAKEASALGASHPQVVPGGILCTGDEATLVRLNLASRIASRVLVRLASVPLAELRRAPIDFRPFLADGGAFRLEIVGGGSRPAELERPILEALRRQVPRARAAGRDEPAQVFVVRLADREVTVSADASGEHLHLRGYRQETGMAPLRENLAAGILALAGYDGTQPLLDPMCGSGTFLIEGALQALRRPPGGDRPFAFDGWPGLDLDVAASVRDELRRTERPAPPAPILGSDKNAGALGVARRNAQRAGVLEHLKLQRQDATAIEPPAPAGILVANPPYGKRVGEEREMADLYRRFGNRLRERFGGWTVAVLFADPRLEKALDLPSPAAHALRNGGIPCRLLVSRIP